MTAPRRLIILLCLPALLVSCGGPQPVPNSTAVVVPSETAVPHAPQIRFGLVGQVTDVNVWALFDRSGYSYNNYAVRSDYWPRLYRLSIPDRQFEPMAADGPPSSFQQEAGYYTATVPLRGDLTWTDGSPFTADDVAFTANTVLAFQLGFDWRDAYNPDWLDHVEAVDPRTVEYFFKQQPNVGMWQYGVLQGPVVQKKYWAAQVAGAAALLPPPDSSAQIETLKAKLDELQRNIDSINQSIASSSGAEAQQTKIALNRQMQKLDQATQDLAQAQSAVDDALRSGRAALYALPDGGEPTLGAWMPGETLDGYFVNDATGQIPDAHPNFDHVMFRSYTDETSALQGLSNGDVNTLLLAQGLSAQSISQSAATQKIMISPTRALRFLVFNPQVPALNDPVLRQAVVCMIDQQEMVSRLGGVAAPLESFVLPQETFWYDSAVDLPCRDLDAAARLARAVQLLKSSGYTWSREPSGDVAGKGLTLPDGSAFPAVSLMVSAADARRTASADYVQQQARMLGIPLTARPMTGDAVDYAVFSRQRYDIALLGWTVSAYPNYLCGWFGAGNPFGYADDRLMSACEALDSSTDLLVAKQHIDELQLVLMSDFPFIPLYAGITVDVYREVEYPFDRVLDGLSSIYGGPSLAIPASR